MGLYPKTQSQYFLDEIVVSSPKYVWCPIKKKKDKGILFSALGIMQTVHIYPKKIPLIDGVDFGINLATGSW